MVRLAFAVVALVVALAGYDRLLAWAADQAEKASGLT